MKRGERPYLWQIRRDLAAVYDAQGQRGEAAAARQAATETAQELAATIDDEGLRDAFLRAAGAAQPKRAADAAPGRQGGVWRAYGP